MRTYPGAPVRSIRQHPSSAQYRTLVIHDILALHSMLLDEAVSGRADVFGRSGGDHGLFGGRLRDKHVGWPGMLLTVRSVVSLTSHTRILFASNFKSAILRTVKR